MTQNFENRRPLGEITTNAPNPNFGRDATSHMPSRPDSVNLWMQVPTDIPYPPLEDPVSLHIPMHFAKPTLYRYEYGNSEADGKLSAIENDFVEFVTDHISELQPIFQAGFQLSRVYNEATENTPTVFAVFLRPAEFRYWEYIHPRLVDIIDRYFPIPPFPIRYYVNSMTYWSSSIAPESIPPKAGKDLPTFGGPGAEGTVRMRDPWNVSQNPVERHMGMSIAVEGPRSEWSTGTLGCYLRLRDEHGKLKQSLYGLTCHHVLSNTTGDIIRPGQSKRIVQYPSMRDYQNTLWTIAESIDALEGEAKIIKSMTNLEIDNSPEQAARVTTEPLLEMSIKEGYKVYAKDHPHSPKAIGKVFALSGRLATRLPRPTTPKEYPVQPPGTRLLDWALIEMIPEEEGQNLFPPSRDWPRQYPADFDILRAGRVVTSLGDIKKGEVVAHAGKYGIKFGTLMDKRVLLTIDDVPVAGTKQTVQLLNFENAIRGVSFEQPFAYRGDSGSAIVNKHGQFVGLLHSGQRIANDRIVYFTPCDILFAEIKKVTGYDAVWAVPEISEAQISDGTYTERLDSGYGVSASVSADKIEEAKEAELPVKGKAIVKDDKENDPPEKKKSDETQGFGKPEAGAEGLSRKDDEGTTTTNPLRRLGHTLRNRSSRLFGTLRDTTKRSKGGEATGGEGRKREKKRSQIPEEWKTQGSK